MKSCVFVESTLSKDEVILIDKDITIYGAIQTRDILKAVKKGFRAIIIIDGNFDFTSSVWHKEILWAIDEGCSVIGCSSMGALRAAELDNYGMTGYGWVYDQYCSNKITSDSDVAVSYFNGDSTIPLVNVRYTLLQYKKVNNAEILSSIASIYYKNRTWASIREVLTSNDYYELKNNYIDIKKIDAKNCLQCLAKLTNTKEIIDLPRTIFLRKILSDVFDGNELQTTVNRLNDVKVNENKLFSKQEYELSKLLNSSKSIGRAGLLLNKDAGYTLTQESFKNGVFSFRKRHGLLLGDEFKVWCEKKELDLGCIDETFRNYLLLRRVIL